MHFYSRIDAGGLCGVDDELQASILDVKTAAGPSYRERMQHTSRGLNGFRHRLRPGIFRQKESKQFDSEC